MTCLKNHLLPLLCLVLILGLKECIGQSYKAVAVAYKVDHEPFDTPLPRIKRNARKYINTIQSINGQADIIVFPEYGLTSLIPKTYTRKHHLKDYSTVIPEPVADVPVDTVLYNISLAAKTNKVYVVINLLEMTEAVSDSLHVYSTDVVFDPEGKLVAKCRKKRLNNETLYDKGDASQSCTFVANFARINQNVKFALLFDTDLSVALPDKTVQNVILTSALPNGLPLSFGLSLQLGFSVRNQVNLLVSGYTNTKEGYGGTGVYMRDGKCTTTLSSEAYVFAEVPIDQNTRDVIDTKVTPLMKLEDIMLTYQKLVMQPIGNPSIKENFLNDGTSYCSGVINTNEGNIEPYKWVAFKATIEVLGQNESVAICALIKPEGRKNEKKTVYSASITVVLKTDEINQVLPLSLGTTVDSIMMPANFQFREDDKDSVTTVSMTLTQQMDLSVFGVLVTLKSAGISLHVSYTVFVGSLLAFLWSKFIL